MHQPACDILDDLLHKVSQCLPGLEGTVEFVRNDQLHCGSQGNPARIAALLAHWQDTHPEAGRHYWSTRCWILLIWQPIYLSLLAVHLGKGLPNLTQMGQSIRQGFVGGFSLPRHRPLQACEARLIDCSAEQLATLLERQLHEFNGVSAIHPKLARLLAADCTRAALLLLQRHQGLDNARLRELEGKWIGALGLPGKSPLIELCLADGRQCLALGRTACCQHFRRADGEPCSGCPKLKPDERLQRLRAELSSGC